MVSIFKERIYTFTCILLDEEPLDLFFNGHTTRHSSHKMDICIKFY